MRQREQGFMEDKMSAVGFVTTQREPSSKTNQSEFVKINLGCQEGAEEFILDIDERRGGDGIFQRQTDAAVQPDTENFPVRRSRLLNQE